MKGDWVYAVHFKLYLCIVISEMRDDFQIDISWVFFYGFLSSMCIKYTVC